RNFFRGPFFWTSSKGQTVYRVTVEVKGAVRTGWVRCGSWWLGLRSEQVEVRWDETPAVEDQWLEAPAQTANPMHDRGVDGCWPSIGARQTVAMAVVGLEAAERPAIVAVSDGSSDSRQIWPPFPASYACTGSQGLVRAATTAPKQRSP